MTRILRLAGPLALLAIITLSATARAGGWVTATVTDMPSGPKSGEKTTIGIEVKQHGVTPINFERVFFLATNSTTKETLYTEATAGSPIGHYVVEVTFPSAGAWDWRLQTVQLVLQPGVYPTINVAQGAAPAPAPVAPAPVMPAPVAPAPQPQPPVATTNPGVEPTVVAGGVLIAFAAGTVLGFLVRRPRGRTERVTVPSGVAAR